MVLSRIGLAVPRFVSESRFWRGITHPYTRLSVRVLRTCGLGMGIYGAGYAYGVQASLDDPEGMGTSILRQVLKSSANGSGLLAADAPESQLVHRLGQELIAAAREHLLQEADEAEEDAKAQERLTAKLRALEKPNWRFVVIDDPSVNAFVTSFLPGFVFVHRGLLKLFEGSPDQLSFILGHELSHYLLEHGTSDASVKGALALLQVTGT